MMIGAEGQGGVSAPSMALASEAEGSFSRKGKLPSAFDHEWRECARSSRSCAATPTAVAQTSFASRGVRNMGSTSESPSWVSS